MIKKLLVILIGAALIILLGVFLYFREYQNLPEFAIPLLSEVKVPAQGEKLIVFAPHTDDETLGAGGLISKSVQNGAEVIVVLITNGDGHRFSSMEEFKKLYPNADDYVKSGYLRQDESKKALEILGVKDENIIFLGYPDSGIKELLNKNWQTPFESPYTKKNYSPYNNSYQKNVSYTGKNLEKDISDIILKYSPTMVVATSPLDMHSDHAATGEFVKKVFEKMDGNKPQLYYYLIHFRHFPSPKGLHKDAMLAPPAKLVQFSSGILKLSLDSQTIDLKQKAVNEYESQLKSPLLKSLMEGFVRQNEIYSEN